MLFALLLFMSASHGAQNRIKNHLGSIIKAGPLRGHANKNFPEHYMKSFQHLEVLPQCGITRRIKWNYGVRLP